MDGVEREPHLPPPSLEEGASGGPRARVLEAALQVFACLDFADQLKRLAAIAARFTDADAAFALGPDEDRQVLVPLGAERVRGEWDLSGTKLALAEVRAWAAQGWPAPPGARFGGALPFASQVVPLRGRDEEPVGLLVLVAPRDNEAVGDVAALADACREALDNALVVRSIRDLVIKDDTVECFNRRYFEEFLNEEMARASRFHAPLSLIFFDMDGLKQVNSLLGHAMGSRCLYEVSVRVRSKVRKFDKLFRFGGDEFCIVLPETEWHGALEVAERVRVAIAGKLFLVDQLGERGGAKMTASFGIASFPLHARTKGELLERADWAMQRVKNGLKNAIAVAEIAGEDHGA